MESQQVNITLDSILSAFLSRHGLRAKDNTLVPFDVIMPTLLMDVCYTTYYEHIEDGKFIHDQRRFSRFIDRSIGHYFHEFWRIWNDEESAFIVDMMDKFRAYINTHVEILANVVWKKLDKYRSEDRDLLSRIMLCNILSQAAGIIHKHIFSRADDNIEKVSFYSQRLLDAVGDKSRVLASNIDLNTFKDVRDAVTILINKIAQFKKPC